MTMTFTEAALSQYPFADSGQMLAPYAPYVYGFAAVAFAAACFALTLQRRSAKRAMIVGFMSITVSMVISWLVHDYTSAQLHDAPATPLGTVASSFEVGGGCTTVRTAVAFKDKGGLSFIGSMSLVPGDILTKKTISTGEEVCKGDGNTTDCRPL